MRKPFDLQGHEVTVTASIGIAVYPDDALDADTLIQYADTAMYRAKEAGRDAFRFFTAEMNAQSMARLDMENALRRAIDNEEFVLFFQPKVHIGSGRVSGAEVLIRWRRPGHGMVSPAVFIPLLEETGLIVRVGNWVLRPGLPQDRRLVRQQHRPGAPVGQCVGHPVLRRRPGRGSAARHPQARYRARSAGTGVDGKFPDVERRGNHRRAAQPEGAGDPDFHRRFRHRLLQPGLSETLSDRQAQDRYRLCARGHQQPRRRGHRAGHYQHGPQHEAAGDRRRRGKRCPAGLFAPPWLR